MQTWGADLSEIDFDDLIYYQNHLTNQPVLGMMYLKRLKKPLNVSGFQKLNVLI